ncbi:translation initiation factor eIF-2B subunit alpha [Tetranychus urticae]|uniref:Translation initiation factor eIF2B subunit alpha n=1 Tax=Tetranychus urticae TaxID=32264 RepID=T1L038_TETUR|nr:translation initiation factor eIF-2B subunit alpha [Tetranychus urticae]
MSSPNADLISIYEKNKASSSSPALATCKALMDILETDNSATYAEFVAKLQKVIETFESIEPLIEVQSISEIFLRFITLTASEYQSIDEMRKALKLRGNLFLDKVVNCTQKIVKYGHPFIYEGSNILVHSYSPVVLETFLFVKKLGKRFCVYVTKSAPDNSGEIMYNKLKAHGIQCSLILDAAIGHFIEKVDMVMVGADGVVENGGIINKIGTYPLALCAKAFNKPLYVLAESYKFIRHYPLNQADIPQPIRGSDKRIRRKSGTVDESGPLVDYTPPNYITLLHTDLGTLTTAAVSDVLIQLYL